MTLLRSHSWPGNVRELKNVIERAVVLSSGPDITAADLPAEVRRGRPG
jgi:DNA-binding NtrC family response regulator